MTELELERMLRSEASELAAQPLPPGLRERLLEPTRNSQPLALRRSAPLLGLLAVQVAVSVAATLAALTLRSAAPQPSPAVSASVAAAAAGKVAATSGATAPMQNFDRVVLEGRHAINEAWLRQITACRRLAGAAFPDDATACRSTTLGLGQAATDFAVRLRAATPPPHLGTGGTALAQALADLQTQCARLVDALDAHDAVVFASAADHLGYQPWTVDMALMDT